ncbi:urease accessory protein UreD [soil metagenome]
MTVLEELAPIAEATPAASVWKASLALGFERRGDASALVRNAHEGPLRVQRPFHPEGVGVSHVVVLHPPSGIAAGDALAVDIDVGAGAHALLTTPGSTKWYRRAVRRAAGLGATQTVTVRVADEAHVEWLPQSSIVHDDADASSTLSIDLAGSATVIGLDIVVLARRSSGERFDHGRWRQATALRRDGRLLWHDSADIEGGSRWLDSPVGLDGCHVVATLFACAPRLEARLAALGHDDPLDGLRVAMPSAGTSLVTGELLLARWLGRDPQTVWREAIAGWRVLRPSVNSRSAVEPRIWST